MNMQVSRVLEFSQWQLCQESWCWLAVRRVGFRRWEILLAALAMTALAAGDTYYAP
jgi:hypothetical protein